MVALTERWPQRVIAIISGWAITALAIYVSLDKPEEQLLPLLIWVAWLVIFMFAYRQLRLDIFMLAGQSYVSFWGIDENDIGHTLRSVIIDPERRLMKTYDGTAWPPDAAERDIRNLLKTYH